MISKILCATGAAAALVLFGCGGTSSTPDAGSTVKDAGGDGTGTGPGSSLKCTSSGKNAWQTYGATAFVAVNEQIFTNVVADMSGKLGTSFGKIGSGMPASTADDLPTFKGNLAAFLVFAYGGPTSVTYTDNKTYAGPQDMVEAHTGLQITSDQYDYFVTSIVVPALTAKGVPSTDVSSCFAPILTDAAFKASIVGH
jgi:hypothetical protein